MVTLIADIRELGSKIAIAISGIPNNMLTPLQLSERLDTHEAYLSGFLDRVVAPGKLQFVDIAGPVKVHTLNSKPK